MASKSLPEMPCGPILELHGQRKRLHIPFGLKPLVEVMARQVIMEQPENIYTYLATLMEGRMKHKEEMSAEEAEKKSWQVHRWSWEASSVLDDSNLQEFLQSLRSTPEDVAHYAIIIQRTFRGYHARVRVREIRKSRGLDRAALGQVISNVAQAQEDLKEGDEVIIELPTLKSAEADVPDGEDVAEPESEYEGEQSVEADGEEEDSDFDSRTYEVEEDMNPYGEGTSDEEDSFAESRSPPAPPDSGANNPEEDTAKSPPNTEAQTEEGEKEDENEEEEEEADNNNE